MKPKDAPPPPPPPSLAEANARLQGRGGGVREKLSQIDADLVKWKAEFKRNPRNGMAKSRCMNLLKQKKMYENQLIQMDNQSFNMDQMQFHQESVQNTIAMVQAQKQTVSAMKEQFKAPEMDIDQIMEMQDDMTDLMEESHEIQELLGQSYEIGEALDEDDLMAELDMIGEEPLDAGAMGEPSYLQPIAQDPGPPLPEGQDQYGLPAVSAPPVPAAAQPMGYGQP